MTKSVMQRAIDAEYGTFEDRVHNIYLINDEDLAKSIVRLSSIRGYSYETGGGVMFDWVLSYDLEEED